MEKIGILLALIACALPAQPQGNASGIIYGPDWAYLIAAPDGFKMDNHALRRQGIWGLFYKRDQPKYLADALNMYINPVKKGGEFPADLESLIAWDIAFFKERNPSLAVKYYKDFELGDMGLCKAYSFDDESSQYYMLYGYATKTNASFVFVLIARSREERAENEVAYEELLKSFVYLDKE